MQQHLIIISLFIESVSVIRFIIPLSMSPCINQIVTPIDQLIFNELSQRRGREISEFTR